MRAGRTDDVESQVKTPAWRGGLLRLFFTGACVVALVAFVDFGRFWADLSRIEVRSVALALVLHAMIVALLGWRWRTILGALGVWRRLDWAIGLTFVATFFNMLLPFSLGGDIGRVLLGRRSNIDLATGTTVAVFDRVVGLTALALLTLLTLTLVPSMLASRGIWMAALLVPGCAVLAALGLAAAVALAKRWEIARRVTDFAGRFLALVHRPFLLAIMTLQSLAGHLLAIVLAYVIASGLGLPLTLAQALLLMPPVLLATALPLSIGGWGVREAAAVPILGLAGVAPAGALAISLLFGVTQLAMAGVGSLAWLALSRNRAGGPLP